MISCSGNAFSSVPSSNHLGSVSDYRKPLIVKKALWLRKLEGRVTSSPPEKIYAMAMKKNPLPPRCMPGVK